MSSPIFPFAAIVGQPQLKRALLLCAIDPSLGGVLIRGDKGTAKSTAARALAEILPSIQRVPGCAFNCAPDAPYAQCDYCNKARAAVAIDTRLLDALDAAAEVAATLGGYPHASTPAKPEKPGTPGAAPGAVPFITLPLGATEDRVLGTLDLQQALDGGTRAFQPGLLAAAHRGILYIDEVNLLADHLVDALLDAAAMGVNSVQREGLSIEHPARFTLIGTMNQEEGDLRPQLLDRFGLMVEVSAPRNKMVRSEVVRRRIGFEAAPQAYVAGWESQQQALREQLMRAQAMLSQVVLDDGLLEFISHLCCEFEVASLRADIVMHKAARAGAALGGRLRVTADDVRDAAELVLPHRRRRKPFEQPGLDRERLDELMHLARRTAGERPDKAASRESEGGQDAAQRADDGDAASARGNDVPGNGSSNGYNNGYSNGNGDAPPGEHDDTPLEQAPQASPASKSTQPSQSGAAGKSEPANHPEPAELGHTDSDSASQVFAATADGSARHLRVETPAASALPGRRAAPAAAAAATAPRGSVVRAVLEPRPSSLALGATLKHAALRDPGDFNVTQADLHQQIRIGTQANLILLVVDASGSMAAQSRMEAVKGAVLALLTDAYQQRDQVAVIAFRGEAASLLLAPTRSVELAEQSLSGLPTGGRTPLPHALQLALETLERAAAAGVQPLLILLSDGRANVPLVEGGDPWRESLALAEQVAERGIASLVLDTEAGFLRLARASQLAQVLGADCLTLEELSAEQLALMIRGRTWARAQSR